MKTFVVVLVLSLCGFRVDCSRLGSGTSNAGRLWIEPTRGLQLTQPNVRFDGVYQSADVDTTPVFWRYFRFYRDLQVITVSSSGTPVQISRWFNLDRENGSRGTYEIDGNSIKFSTTSSYGTVEYDGVIEDGGDKLVLDTVSKINGNTRNGAVFNFVQVTFLDSTPTSTTSRAPTSPPVPSTSTERAPTPSLAPTMMSLRLSESGGSDVSVIVGGLVAAIGIICVAAVVIAIAWIRSRRQGSADDSEANRPPPTAPLETDISNNDAGRNFGPRFIDQTQAIEDMRVNTPPMVMAIPLGRDALNPVK